MEVALYFISTKMTDKHAVSKSCEVCLMQDAFEYPYDKELKQSDIFFFFF